MTIKRVLTLALAAAAANFFSPVLAEELATCGQATYYPTEYTCHNDKTLCPTQYSLPTKPCAGSGGCYPPEQFSCGEDGVLRTLPSATSPFTLTVWGVRSAYRNQTVRACGGYLAIGANARQCHACTAAGGTNCGVYRNQTVFLTDGRMASAVPGHQYWYINPRDGLLAYTPALAPSALPPAANSTQVGWNATTPITYPTVPNQEFAGLNVKIHENGFFVWDKEGAMSHWWFACLVTLPGGGVSTARSWRIYAPVIPDKRDCELVKIVAKAQVDERAGVYKYV
ncbi:hypothetical protein QBC35DRAFT_546658 [Podospora australis]|uniref:Endo-1,3(4)-beta-glucanase 1 carbohydrate binding domain-containing protein n=1 Tax=Podospora australis TaxID=1536484 RepID=A0AAN7AE28_9PEZI|nr:hypothetical protein QBC35DRAFT_546658 [Podospora australis]